MSCNHLPSFELAGSIWFRSGKLNWGNPRRMALLAAIHEHGSISAAARHIDLSYKAAWDAVDTINNLADTPLILRTTGGQRGGGASLTPQALEILELYQQLDAAHQQFMQRLAKAQPGSNKNIELLQTMMLHTSARNNFSGTISSITKGAVNADIKLDLGNQQSISAAITRDSLESMELTVGSPVLAFLKASAIVLALPTQSHFSASNQMSGTIVRIESGAINAEIGIELSAKHRLAAIIPMDSVERMGLKVDQPIVALFNATDVLLGTF